MTEQDIIDAIWAVNNADVVETIFASANNPTQRQSFVYVKSTLDGFVIIVEAVGGNYNKNVSPIEIHKFTQSKWNELMSKGLSIGELLYEHDTKKLAALDATRNKNNRVIAAQYAQKNGSASSAFSSVDNSVSQTSIKSNNNKRRKNPI